MCEVLLIWVVNTLTDTSVTVRSPGACSKFEMISQGITIVTANTRTREHTSSIIYLLLHLSEYSGIRGTDTRYTGRAKSEDRQVEWPGLRELPVPPAPVPLPAPVPVPGPVPVPVTVVFTVLYTKDPLHRRLL